MENYSFYILKSYLEYLKEYVIIIIEKEPHHQSLRPLPQPGGTL